MRTGKLLQVSGSAAAVRFPPGALPRIRAALSAAPAARASAAA